jgi:DNA polymerase-1
MQIKYIDKVEDFNQVRADVLSAGVVAFDVETTGFDPKIEKLRTMQFSVNPEKAYVVDMGKFNDPRSWKFFCDVLADPTKVVIAQNGKFDLKFFTHFIGQGPLAVESFYDTMITSQLIGRGNPELRHGLDGIARRELGVYLDKTLQKSDFSGPLSDEQIQYAGRDAAILLRIRDAQLLQVQRYGLERVARLESDAVAAIADLELNGFYLDQEAWSERTTEQQSIANNLREQILFAFEPFAMQVDLFGQPVINIDSPEQVLPFLKALGVPITSSTSEDELKPYMRMPIVKTFLDYREVHTALIKFGPKYLGFRYKHQAAA